MLQLTGNGKGHKRFYAGGMLFRSEYSVADDEPSSWYVRATQVDEQRSVFESDVV